MLVAFQTSDNILIIIEQSLESVMCLLLFRDRFIVSLLSMLEGNQSKLITEVNSDPWLDDTREYGRRRKPSHRTIFVEVFGRRADSLASATRYTELGLAILSVSNKRLKKYHSVSGR